MKTKILNLLDELGVEYENTVLNISGVEKFLEHLGIKFSYLEL